MNRTDQHVTVAPADLVFKAAVDVERWPELVPAIRRARFRERRGVGSGVVEVAAARPMAGPLAWPVRWTARMEADPDDSSLRFHHIAGSTAGLESTWVLLPADEGTVVRVMYQWDGPSWPLIGRPAARYILGPHVFSPIVHHILRGLCGEAERLAALETEGAA